MTKDETDKKGTSSTSADNSHSSKVAIRSKAACTVSSEIACGCVFVYVYESLIVPDEGANAGVASVSVP